MRIVSAAHANACSGARRANHGPIGSKSRTLRNSKVLGVVGYARGVIGKRNKFRFARDVCEPAFTPIRCGLRQARFAARDKIPPEVTRAVERFAAEEEHTRMRPRSDIRIGKRAKHEQLSGAERLA